MYEFSKEKGNITQLLMPMSQDKSSLTLSPLVGMVDVLEYNTARKMNDLFLFELSCRYDKDETPVVCGAMTGTLSSTNWKGEQEVVELIKSLHRKPKGKKRMSYAKIANELNKRDIKPRKADMWEAKTVYNIINRK